MTTKDKGSIVRKLERNDLLRGVKPFILQTHYEVIMGSFAYGVSNVTSDIDVYGVFTPSIELVFPHVSGHIRGFGKTPDFVDTYQKHHIQHGDKEYDLALYNIVKYFQLLTDNNPNIIDSLFVPSRCIVHMDDVGSIIRENRRLFLHKGIYQKLNGYAFAQLKKLRTKNFTGKRKADILEHGYSTKFAYHIVRLVQQCEMVMVSHDLDLEGNRELLKSVRRGDWTLDEIEAWFKKRQGELETLYVDSDLRYSPDYDVIKQLLMQCLEAHFGSLSAYFNSDGSERLAQNKIDQIRAILN